jgi:hypothetical protein
LRRPWICDFCVGHTKSNRSHPSWNALDGQAGPLQNDTSGHSGFKVGALR